MKYRMGDPDNAAQSAIKGIAMTAERSAFSLEVEVERQKALADAQPTAVQVKAIDAATDRAVSARRNAERKKKRVSGKIDPKEVDAVHASVLKEWITALENDHATHVAVVDAINEDLRVKGVNAIPKDEVPAVKEDLATRQISIKNIETSHELACEMLDAIEGENTD